MSTTAAFLCRLKDLAAALGTCRRGVTTIVVTISATTLALASLLAVDVARAHLAFTRLQQATDAAALAGGRDFYSATLAADMRQIFDANFTSGYLGASVERFQHAIATAATDAQLLTLKVVMRLPSPVAAFLDAASIDAYHLSASATVERRTRGMELALVLDITGSMVDENKIGGLKTAATELINILYGARESVPNLWVGVVPYIASVNVGTANIGFLPSSDRARATPSVFSPDGWGGCVVARAAPRDQNDDPPSVQGFKSYLYPDVSYPGLSSDSFVQRSYDNNWGAPRNPPTRRWVEYSGTVPYTVSYGPNSGCPPVITPLTVQKSTVLAAINALQPEYRGGTVTNEGIAWGWRVVSPRWRGLWSGAPGNLPLAYGSANMDKVMVVLTDGDNQMLVFSYSGSLYSPYNAYETYKTFTSSSNTTTATNATKAALDTRTLNVCTSIKQQGIILYTITFGASPSSTGQSLMRSCATDPAHYFHSPDATTLRTVFRSIGSRLTSLRITQ